MVLRKWMKANLQSLVEESTASDPLEDKNVLDRYEANAG